jgi:S1-C subfamily serine protease
MERVVLRHLKGSRASQLEEFPLQQFAELVFGRDPASSVRFDPERDDLVGRQHARIVREAADPHRFKLVDLNSRNGTFLNKLRVVGEMPIQPGDVIQLGAGGPEIQFDLDPLPAIYVKATRLGVAGPVGGTAGGGAAGLGETRVGATGASGALSSPSGGGAPNAIGKATVERLIGDTKRQANRQLYVGAGAVAFALIGLLGFQQYRDTQNTDEARRRERALADSVAKVQAEGKRVADSLAAAVGRSVDLSKKMVPAEIRAKNAASTVLIDFSWNLIYAPTGAQVYHRYMNNSVRIGNRTVPIIPGGPARIPAYISVGTNEIEPALTITQEAGEPIGVTGSASGFVIAANGFILTNRHVAANWRAPYPFHHQVGVLVNAAGQILLNQANAPILVDPPARWIPSESKQTGPKQELDVFRGRQEYLYVRFPKNLTPVEATTARVSDRHDVAMIKVDVPSSLQAVVMHDAYSEIAGGEAVTVLGYPSVSDNIVAVLGSKDTFNREAQVRTVPDPTLSTGNVGKVLRAVDGRANDVYETYAPFGDRYQLTINSTAGGNSGGPMFDEYGRVVGIYFAGRSADAQISFAVPIRFGLELMNVTPNTK